MGRLRRPDDPAAVNEHGLPEPEDQRSGPSLCATLGLAAAVITVQAVRRSSGTPPVG